MSITVFMCDDHGIVRDGLRCLIEANHDITVIGEAANGEDAIRAVSKLKPDIVIMDIAMPGVNGLEAAERILKIIPSSKIIILTMYFSLDYITRAINIGVSGYILKDAVGNEIIKAIREINKGHRFMSQKVADYVWNEQGRKRLCGGTDPLSILSLRELEVLKLVAAGKTSLEIANTIFLSPKTVETYRSRIMQKLNIDNLTGLIKFAIRYGLTQIEND